MHHQTFGALFTSLQLIGSRDLLRLGGVTSNKRAFLGSTSALLAFDHIISSAAACGLISSPCSLTKSNQTEVSDVMAA